jgi:hypothetical protein
MQITPACRFRARSTTPTRLTLDAGVPWTEPLAAPVALYGNVITASRGESVNGEWLGTGDASVPGQSFKLKKSPLTYLAAGPGLASTLRVYANGVQWTEAPSFFGIAGDARVYIVRENDDGESMVTFGDGVRGSRLATGSGVIAYYRFGAGEAAPPAGSIKALAKPVPGLSSVRNPVAASGGEDAESSTRLRTSRRVRHCCSAARFRCRTWKPRLLRPAACAQ